MFHAIPFSCAFHSGLDNSSHGQVSWPWLITLMRISCLFSTERHYHAEEKIPPGCLWIMNEPEENLIEVTGIPSSLNKISRYPQQLQAAVIHRDLINPTGILTTSNGFLSFVSPDIRSKPTFSHATQSIVALIPRTMNNQDPTSHKNPNNSSESNLTKTMR